MVAAVQTRSSFLFIIKKKENSSKIKKYREKKGQQTDGKTALHWKHLL
jgi:hypothetical protein